MKLYLWNSKFLQEYSDGEILAVANSLEEAKKLAIAWYVDYYDEDVSPFYLEDLAGEPTLFDLPIALTFRGSA